MCRFVFYVGQPIRLATLLTEPRHSIIHQSYHAREREEPLNGDGHGVAWYAPDDPVPAALHAVSPAWNNTNLLDLARVTTSTCILAHVRAASPGLPVTQLNCHPFAAGPLAFMHNGYVGGFPRIVRRLRAELSDDTWSTVRGSTDSEHVFALLREALDPARPGLDGLATAMRVAIERVETMRREAGETEPSTLNLVATDGHCAVAVRYHSDDPDRGNSLYVHEGRRYVCEDGVCHMVEPDDGRGAVIVASERLSSDPGWDRVPGNHLVRICDKGTVAFEPIGV